MTGEKGVCRRLPVPNYTHPQFCLVALIEVHPAM